MGFYSFDPVYHRDKAIEWLKETGESQKFNKVVLGISGGKDSTVAAALCCRAFGSENVHGLLMPDGIQSDIDDSIEVCNSLGIKYDTININVIKQAITSQYRMFAFEESGDPCIITDEAYINVAPRIRMILLRLWAQSHHHRVCGTSNFSEITVGYCTKDGDTSCDFNPLGRLTSLEVVEIGRTMDEIPARLVTKTPADGLSGMSDEEKLGINYKDIHNYIRNIPVDKEIWYKIHDKELAGLHKRTNAPFYEPKLIK